MHKLTVVRWKLNSSSQQVAVHQSRPFLEPCFFSKRWVGNTMITDDKVRRNWRQSSNKFQPHQCHDIRLQLTSLVKSVISHTSQGKTAQLSALDLHPLPVMVSVRVIWKHCSHDSDASLAVAKDGLSFLGFSRDHKVFVRTFTVPSGSSLQRQLQTWPIVGEVGCGRTSFLIAPIASFTGLTSTFVKSVSAFWPYLMQLLRLH